MLICSIFISEYGSLFYNADLHARVFYLNIKIIYLSFTENDSGPSSSPLQFDMSPVNSLPSNYYGSNSDLEDSSPMQSSFNKKISSNCRSVTTTLSETIFHLDLSDEGVGSWKDTEEHKKATWAGLGYPIECGLAKRRALKLQRLSTGSNDSGNISSSSPPSRPQLLQTDK